MKLVKIMNYYQQDCYGFALNQHKQLVSIDQAVQLRKDGHQTSYYCPNTSCNGELTTVMGNVRRNHFRHKTSHTVGCSAESVEHHLAKTIIENAINQQTKISLFFHCAMCNKQKYDWPLPSKINRAQKEYLYPNTLYRGDVAAFEADDHKPTVMFEVYYSHRVDSIKQAGISRWVEVSANQIIKSFKDNPTHYQWDVISASSSKKPLLCADCKSAFDSFISQNSRQQHLPRHFKKISDIYKLYNLLVSESVVSTIIEDMMYWSRQLANISTNSSTLAGEQLKTDNNQLINTLYKLLRSPASNFFLTQSDEADFILSALVDQIDNKSKAKIWKNVFVGKLAVGKWQLKLVMLFITPTRAPNKTHFTDLTNQIIYNDEAKKNNNSLAQIALFKSQGKSLDKSHLVDAVLQAFKDNYLLRFFLENPEFFNIDLLSATHDYGFNQPHFRSKSYYLKLIEIAPKIQNSELTLNWLNDRLNPHS